MRAVHAERLAEQAAQHGALRRVHEVAQLRVEVHKAQLLAQILIQRAAHRDVDHLLAAADAHDGLARRQKRAHQRHFERVARGVDVHGVVELRLAEEGRLQIAAAGEQQRVVDRSRGLRRLLAQHAGDAARHGDGVGIGRRTLEGPEIAGLVRVIAADGQRDKRTIVVHGTTLPVGKYADIIRLHAKKRKRNLTAPRANGIMTVSEFA